MHLRIKHVAQMVVIWSLVVFPGAELSHSICNDTYNNQGPYFQLNCYEDVDCDNGGAGWSCQEEDCENCLHQQTGQVEYCVAAYDCGTVDACYNTICT